MIYIIAETFMFVFLDQSLLFEVMIDLRFPRLNSEYYPPKVISRSLTLGLILNY